MGTSAYDEVNGTMVAVIGGVSSNSGGTGSGVHSAFLPPHGVVYVVHYAAVMS